MSDSKDRELFEAHYLTDAAEDSRKFVFKKNNISEYKRGVVEDAFYHFKAGLEAARRGTDTQIAKAFIKGYRSERKVRDNQ